MNKSKLLVLLAALCVMLTLAACGESYASNNGTATPIDPAEESTDGLNTDTPVILPTVDAVTSIGEGNNTETVDLGCCVTGIVVRETALLGANSVTQANNDFIMTLNSDKLTYNTTDIIRIWGTLEYVGDNDTIEIWSGCPFMLFSISGGHDIDFGGVLGGATVDVLVSSVLERGRVYHFDYQKSGGWSTDDPNAEYWENFFGEEDLLLPVGEYTITLNGGFSLSERILGSESGLSTELRIVVTDNIPAYS